MPAPMQTQPKSFSASFALSTDSAVLLVANERQRHVRFGRRHELRGMRVTLVGGASGARVNSG